MLCNFIPNVHRHCSSDCCYIFFAHERQQTHMQPLFWTVHGHVNCVWCGFADAVKASVKPLVSAVSTLRGLTEMTYWYRLILFWCSKCITYVTFHDIVFCTVMEGTVAALQASRVGLPVGQLWYSVITLDQSWLVAGSTLCAKWGPVLRWISEDAREFCNLVDFSSRRRVLYTIEVKKNTHYLILNV